MLISEKKLNAQTNCVCANIHGIVAIVKNIMNNLQYFLEVVSSKGNKKFVLDTTDPEVANVIQKITTSKSVRIHKDYPPIPNAWGKSVDKPAEQVPTHAHDPPSEPQSLPEDKEEQRQNPKQRDQREPLLLQKASMSQLMKAFERGFGYDEFHREVAARMKGPLTDFFALYYVLEKNDLFTMDTAINRMICHRGMQSLPIADDLKNIPLYRTYLSNVLKRLKQIIDHWWFKTRHGLKLWDEQSRDYRFINSPEIDNVNSQLGVFYDTYFGEHPEYDIIKQMDDIFAHVTTDPVAQQRIQEQKQAKQQQNYTMTDEEYKKYVRRRNQREKAQHKEEEMRIMVKEANERQRQRKHTQVEVKTTKTRDMIQNPYDVLDS